MPSDYVENLLQIYNMQKANPASNTGSPALKRIDDADSPLSPFQIGKVSWTFVAMLTLIGAGCNKTRKSTRVQDASYCSIVVR